MNVTLSQEQRAIGLMHELDPESSAFNVAGAIRIVGTIDAEALRRSIAQVVARHPQLRCRFARVDSQLVPDLESTVELDFQARESSVIVQQQLDDEANLPFDLQASAPLRVRLHQTASHSVLLVVMHSIVADRRSLVVFMRELGVAYRAERGGLLDGRETTTRSYADYVRAQSALLASPAAEAHGAFWEEQLGDEPTPLDLPFDRQRPRIRNLRGATVAGTLDAAFVHELDRVASEANVQRDDVLLAAYATLLLRYAGRTDAVIGIETFDRPAEYHDTIGYFENALPLQIECGRTTTFAELATRVHHDVVRGREHRGYPLQALVERVKPASDPSRAPLFQTTFGIDAADELARAFASAEGVRAETVPLGHRGARYDLSLRVCPSEAGIELRLDYSVALFDESTVRRLLANLERLLHAIVATPGERVSRLPILTERELAQVTREWNDTAQPGPADPQLHVMFENQVARTPDAVAVTAEGVSFTYRELDRAANGLALHLCELGVAPEVLVGISGERSIDMVVAIIAVLKAGGGYVPLDPSFPPDRLAFMVRDTKLSLILSHGDIVATARDAHPDTTVLDVGPFVRSGGAAQGPAPRSTPQNIAYAIYSSGSTGLPKGVLMPHSSISNIIAWSVEGFRVTPADRMLQSRSLSFDVSLWEIFTALTAGATVVISREQDSDAIARVIGDEGITIVALIPSEISVLLPSPAFTRSRLRHVGAGAEALLPVLRDRFFAEMPDCELSNNYGPSETADMCTHWMCHPGDKGGATVPIGRPLMNVRIYILDADLRPVPIGVPGELFIGGRQLARGYHARPALTAEKFIPDPFSDEPGARMYRTGDVARWLPEGAIDFIGRADNQVKVSGFRVELGEIESVLSGHEALREAVVLAPKLPTGHRRLVAFVVPHAGVATSAGEIRAYLKDRLPHYMVPSAIVVRDSLPLGPTGKVDRKALALPTGRDSLTSEYVAPRTDTEARVATAFAEVLEIERVGLEDDFFELGGNSLLVTKLASRLRQAFAIELPLRSLFESSTVASVAALVETMRESPGATSTPIVPVPRDAGLDLSFAQQRLWFLDQYQPGSPVYNESCAIEMIGPLDVGALERSFDAMIARQESLRTRFPMVQGKPRQVIDPPWSLALPVVDVAPGEAEPRAIELSRQPFDLAAGPLLRCELLRLGPQTYWLVMVAHHIVNDGWSLGIMQNELAELYRAFVAGTQPSLPALPVQYADYAVWQRRWLEGEGLATQLRYWQDQLRGLPPLLEVPTDHPRPPVLGYRGARRGFALPAQLRDGLTRLGRDESATLYVTLLAAFQVLLHRYSRSDDIAVASPVAGRNREELEGLVGFFVNTLVMRTDLSGSPTFREALRRVREVQLGALDHQDVPFEKLVEALSPQRSLSYAPLVQVMFVMETPPENPQLPGIQQRLFELDIGRSKFDLSLMLEEQSDGGLRGTVEFNTDLYEVSTIDRLISHFQRLLEAVIANPSAPISELPILGDAERAQLVAGFNDTARRYPAGWIHERIEAQVDRAPDAIALEYLDQQLTYAEVDRRANQLAHYLRERGAGPEVLVGVAMERSFEMVISLLAIVKAGAAYVPIDPGYPPDRIAYMIEDSSPSVLLTQAHLRDQLPAARMPVLAVDAAWPEIATRPATRPAIPLTGQSLAYMIYTSGSTGRPKGAMNSHAGIANRLDWMQEQYQLTPADRVLQKTPFSFDVSVWEFFWPLMYGARLVVAKPEGHKDPAYLVDTIVKYGITTLHFVPSMLAAFLEDAGVPRCTSLRQVMASGEALPFELVERFHRVLSADLHNLYGPTEAAVDVSHWTCPRSGASLVPIGKPIANIQLYVLDPHLEPVPIGAPGEIHIGGIGVGRGYLGRPALTAEKFIPDPFNPGARLYKTGDLGRVRADGSLEYLGRIDHQVKLRGFRIELGEIEAALMSHPTVHSAVVILADVNGDKRLVGYVAPTGTIDSVDIQTLKMHISGKLPEYMVPSIIMVLEKLPLSPNGKIDRKLLPAPDTSGSGVDYVEPRSATERSVADMFAEILRAPKIGAADDFFMRGGHSLLATQVVSRVRTAFDIDLPLRVIFEAPTVAALASRIDAVRTDTTPVAEMPIGTVSRELADLSFAQERLWFLDQLEPDSPLYNVPDVMRLRGALDVQAIERSVNAIIARHESLRTTFAVRAGRAVQEIAPALAIDVPRVDFTQVPDAQRAAAAMKHAIEHARRPFDIRKGPLIRAQLLVLAPDEHWLFVSMHHIVTDGWSYGVFWRELGAFYDAFTHARQPALAPLPIQYVDFAAWQRTWLAGDELARQLDYWTNQLRGAPSLLELPTDRPRPALLTFNGSYRTFELSKATTAAVRALSRDTGSTLFMTLLAAFQTLLHRYSGQTDIVVGSPVANRTRQETEDLIGFFVNTLVMRTDLSGDPTFRQLLTRVRDVALGAYGHQDLPFEKLVAELQPERSLSYAPVFQVMFILQNAGGTTSMPGLEHSIVELDTGTSKFDLTLQIDEKPDVLVGTVEYNTDLYDAATIDRMIGHFERLLAGIVADPQTKLSTLPLLSDAEHRQLVVDWNATALEYPRDKTVHELFAEQVARTPDAIALEHEGTRLTYRELDRRTNQLAHHLRTLGVGVEDMVAIFCERSLEMCIGMIAVHKAGGAYVPLDPNYPEDRIAFIQEDTRCPVILTQERLVPRLPPAGSAKVVRLDTDWPQIARASDAQPSRSSNGDHLSHIIYTSGSTGRPKGVAIEHHSVVSFCYWARGVFSDHERSGVLFSTSICFDLSVFELFVTLVWGGRVILVENALSLPQLPAATNVILVNSVPSVIATVLKTATLPASVETVNLAGEPLKNALVHQLYETKTVRKVVDLYGPSETTTYSTFTTRVDGAPPSIGVPLANTQCYVLDAHRQLVPRGVAGELYIAGDGVAREYLGRPELTAEKFLPNPFAPGRMYRTGDLVRWLPNGTLEYVGRIDHQVKIRGFRIELGEIEARLGQHASVRETVVLAREDIPGDKRLVAYIVARPGSAVDEAELRAHIKQMLPEYMVPSAFVVLDKLPQTPNGKIDRKALPAPETTVVGEIVPPATPTEFTIANIFAEVLHVPAVGANDDFFARGGHSLLATQVISRVRSQLGVELPLRALFEDPTVARFAARVDAAAPAQGSTQVEPITRVDRAGTLPLSFAQQRMWFLDVLEPGSSFYHLGQAVRLHGTLDVGALERSVVALVERHEALRTTFPTRDGAATQVIAAHADIQLPVVDLSRLDPLARETEVKRLYLEDAQRPFDLARGPLVRGSILRLGKTEHVLLLAFHHIVYDGWSAGVMWRELASLYGAFIAGEPPALPPLAIQYPDFAAWQRRYLAGDVYDRQLRYWRDQLRGAPSLLELPTDRPRPPVQRFQGGYVPFELSPKLAGALHALSRQESVTLFVVLLAAFQTLLHRYSRQDDISVGSPVANRNRGELEALIGFFVNTLVLRTDLSGAPTFRELLSRVREVALGAYDHQDIPFEKLVEELRPERTLSHSPLFQVVFVLQSAAMVTPKLPGLQTERVELDNGTAKFDLSLIMEESGDTLRGGIEYRTDLWDAVTIERMLGHFTRLLEAIVANPNAHINEIALLDGTERHRLLVDWNARTNDHPRSALLHELFEGQVARQPAALAVAEKDHSLTYAELDARATSLARRLVRMGVGVEHVVALVLERSIDTVVAHLAVLKAGAAYLPVDPSTPADRIEFMLADAGVRVVLYHARTAAKVAGLAGEHLAIDALGADGDTTTPLPPITPDHLAYVIYTSGSTGQPKGVMISHLGIVNLVAAIRSELRMQPDDRITSMSSPAFDALQLELWPALASGSCVDVIDDQTRAVPDRLWQLFRTRKVTGSFMPTPLAELALEAAETFDDLSLRYIYTGGDRLRRSAHAGAPFRLVNMYGPTETSVVATAGDVPVGATMPPIGRQLENVTCYILDDRLQPVPTGVAGELFVGGISVARGYLRRPKLTAEKFVPDPFSGVPGSRLYRTGDLVRYLPDGQIEFLGRTDHQVKIRGLRIELGEIEAALSRMPGVREAIVLARGDGTDKRLVAFIAGDDVGDPGRLQSELKKTLPEYMVPSAFVVLDELPLTQNGKTDRNALLAMPLPSNRTEAERIDPRTRTELEIGRIVAELLGLDSVGANDDFFALGGHSLLAAQLFATIEKRLGASLPVATLFRAPTIEALAREVDAVAAGAVRSRLIPLRVGGTRTPLVLVHPGGGTVFSYQALVASLAGDRPCFGLESKGLVEGEAPAETIAEMAATYATWLREVVPHGPYHLVGWSFGGIVALELANVLAAAGEEVISTTLVDTFAPATQPESVHDRVSVLGMFARDLGLAITDDELRGLAPDAALARVVELARAAALIPPQTSDDEIARRARVFGTNLAAYARYVPRAPATRLALIRAQEMSDGDPADGWSGILPGLEVRTSPGSHYTMVASPNVKELAALIDQTLAAT